MYHTIRRTFIAAVITLITATSAFAQVIPYGFAGADEAGGGFMIDATDIIFGGSAGMVYGEIFRHGEASPYFLEGSFGTKLSTNFAIQFHGGFVTQQSCVREIFKDHWDSLTLEEQLDYVDEYSMRGELCDNLKDETSVVELTSLRGGFSGTYINDRFMVGLRAIFLGNARLKGDGQFTFIFGVPVR